MKRRRTIAWAALLLPLGIAHAETISDIVGRVSTGSYSSWHSALFTSDGNSRGFTYPGSVREPAYQHDAARDFIASSFESMGFDTWLDPFSFTISDGSLYTNCNNVVAVKPGNGGTNVFIIGAHYDSVDPADASGVTLSPGADDNASGVAALLETAQAIKGYTFRDTLVLIAFDAEEKGYQGAKHFLSEHITDQSTQTNATRFLKAAIKGMMSVDTIAYDDTNTPKRVIIGSMGTDTNSPIDLALAQSATRYTDLLPVRNDGWDGSDHNPFHNAGIDAVLLIEGDFFDYGNPSSPTFQNPHYHSDADSSDSPGYISYGYAATVTKCIVGYLCEQAQVIPPATLNSSTQGTTSFLIGWETTPGVAYALLGTESLIQTNSWQLIGLFEGLEGISALSAQLDIHNETRRFYKVESR